MSTNAKIGLDNPAFSGRLRQRATVHTRVAPRSAPQATGAATSLLGSEEVAPTEAETLTPIKPIFEKPLHVVEPSPAPARVSAPTTETSIAELVSGETGPSASLSDTTKLEIVAPEPFAKPGQPKQQRSTVLRRQSVKSPFAGQFDGRALAGAMGQNKRQKSLFAMAVIVFIFGMAVSISTILTNQKASSQVSALSAQAEKQATTSDAANVIVPSTTKPNNNAYSSYTVAPDLARYLKIPKLGVDSRVLQVGVKADGSVAAPNNVYDTAWYNGSAKPGQAGATLIDGHVSSWTSRGVFYGIKNLVTGDTIQVQKGDNSTLTYKVVKTQVYDAANVDMRAAMQPVTAGKSGLNLITCTGQVKKGTSEFNQRVIVFAEQV